MSGVIRDIDIALEAARAGAAIVREGLGNSGEPMFKSSAVDPVTATDHASDLAILDVIRWHRPSDATLSEESGGSSWEADRVWIADPLDGTVNFLHGFHHVAVSVALWGAGLPIAGVVIDVARGDEYVAERGGGAFVGGRPLSVSDQCDPGRALVVTGFPYDRQANPRRYTDVLARVLGQVQGVRRTGSAALDLCYVAAGRFDAYWEVGLKAWDGAAGLLIAQEAGARVSGLGGAEYRLGGEALIVSNGHLHDAITTIIGVGW